MSKLRTALSVFAVLALTACASNPDNRTARRSSSYECPAGETLICEVTNTGRITHGSFGKRGTSRCSCQDEGRAGPTIIPDVHQ